MINHNFNKKIYNYQAKLIDKKIKYIDLEKLKALKL